MNVIDVTNSVPALPDLFVFDEKKVNLIGSKCSSCQTHFFPFYHEQHRPGCERKGIEKILFDAVGVLKSYAVQHYQAPLPFKTEKSIAPYTIGMVEFNGEIQIAGIVVGCSENTLRVGLKMNTTVFELHKNEDGKPVLTWAFEPLEEGK